MRDGKAAWTGYTLQNDNAGEPRPVLAFLFACGADHNATHNQQYVQPLQRLFLSRLNIHLSFKIRRVCVSEGAMPPSWADRLSPRTFCQLCHLVPACSHGLIAENMSGGSCVPDAVPSAQPLLHVSPACRDPFHGEPASRISTSGSYLLSSPLRPGIAA